MDIWHLKVDECPLAQDQRDKLSTCSRRLSLGENQFVFAAKDQADAVYLLESGIVQLFRLDESGDQLILGFARPGEVFGLLDPFSDLPREGYAEAMTEVTVLEMPKKQFEEALVESALTAITLTKQLARRTLRIERRLEQLAFKSARARLASVILELADDFGSLESDIVCIDIDLTQSELGYLIAASRPTVSITLNEFEHDDRLIRRGGKRILVLDRDGLESIARNDRPRASLKR